MGVYYLKIQGFIVRHRAIFVLTIDTLIIFSFEVREEQKNEIQHYLISS
jgi:hypothetical protein